MQKFKKARGSAKWEFVGFGLFGLRNQNKFTIKEKK